MIELEPVLSLGLKLELAYKSQKLEKFIFPR